jgi:hypothetical protein
MLTASLLLLVIALFGAFDCFYFHRHVAKLSQREESRLEVGIHVARGFVYAAQLLVIPNLELHGYWLLPFVVLFIADVGIALYDVAIEPESRRSQGGLPRGEYVMHIVLSVLVGAYLNEVVRGSLGWWQLPTGIALRDEVPLALRAVLALMAVGSLGLALLEWAVLATSNKPRPVHVGVVLDASLQEVWDTTQDHVKHPSWDHRFSRIEMLSERIGTGTEMVYEKRLMGLLIRGFGRYKLHKPMRQSTFEFWSEDRLSLIRRGVGLWLYDEVAPGVVWFRTSYTYDVRWGLLGRVVDALIFRRWFQAETERSFKRLAARYFEQRVEVGGAHGRKPARLERLAVA